MAEHTELPWEAVKCWDSENWTVMRGTASRVAFLHELDGSGEANAALIVRCVNSHEALVKALQDIVEPIAALQRDLPDGHELNGSVAVQLSNNAEHLKSIARAALLAAREVKP